MGFGACVSDCSSIVLLDWPNGYSLALNVRGNEETSVYCITFHFNHSKYNADTRQHDLQDKTHPTPS